MRLRNGVVLSELDGEGVILDKVSGRYLSLNESGLRILKMLLAGQSNESVIVRVVSETGAERARVEREVVAFRENLLSEGLLEEQSRR